MKALRFLAPTMAMMGLVWLTSAAGQTVPVKEVIAKPTVRTEEMGGVPLPSKHELEKMHRSQYILHASKGRMTRLAVEKALLPHDQPMSPQGAQIDLGPDGTLYVKLASKLAKSVDGGRTWTAQPIHAPQGYTLEQTGRWKVLSEGRFICVTVISGEGETAPAQVWSSKDEGLSWRRIAEIPLGMKMPRSGEPYDARYCHRGLDRLGETLIWTIELREYSRHDTGQPISRKVQVVGSVKPLTQMILKDHELLSFRSTDGGRNWQGPLPVWDWANEGAATRLPSGEILATVRVQRHKLPQDPPELVKLMGFYATLPDEPGLKNVFLMNSKDDGIAWSWPRMLTTVYGQTFGYPAAQSDGTVVVVHDTRYGPGSPGSRALISRDEGKTWKDEVYYLDSTNFPGSYSASVVLADDTILTLAGSCADPSVGGFSDRDWERVKDTTDFYAIRWKPVKE